MKTYITLSLLFLFALMSSCKKGDDSSPVSINKITVDAFTPVAGLPDSIITITGTGFSDNIAQDTVTFASNITATVTAATATQLKVRVPAGAVTGKISVTVGSQTAVSADTFEISKDIPRNGLVAFYPCTGNANDASGFGNNLTVYPGVTTLITDRFGKINHAYAFAGGSAALYTLNTTKPQLVFPFTISLWIKYDSLMSSGILSKYTFKKGLYVGALSNGVLGCVFDSVNVNSTAPVLPMNTHGQWICLSITYDGTALSIYKNGSFVETINYASSLSTVDGTLHIGPTGDADPSPYAFKCQMDDMAFYNRVLNANEIQQLYEQTVSKN